ncbi:uncharacterized protein LOC144907877 [Branchiostoma floridae x Branchiostoma belcheri]
MNQSERQHRGYRYTPIPGAGTVGIELQELSEMQDTGHHDGEHFIREGRPLYASNNCMRSKTAVTALCMTLVLVIIIALGVGIKIDQPSTTRPTVSSLKLKDFAFRGRVKILGDIELTPEMDAQLHDPSSAVFMTLAKEIKQSLAATYKKSSLAHAYSFTEIKRLRKGVFCNFVIHFRADRDPDLQTVRSVLAHTTTLGHLTIDPEFTTITRNVHQPVPSTTTALPTTTSTTITTTTTTTTTAAAAAATTTTGTTTVATTSQARPTTTMAKSTIGISTEGGTMRSSSELHLTTPIVHRLGTSTATRKTTDSTPPVINTSLST